MNGKPSPNRYRSDRLMGRLWRDYLRRHTGWMLIALVLMVIEGGSLGVLSYLLKPMFDQVFVGRDEAALWWVGGAIFGLFLLRAFTSVAQRVIMTRVAVTTATDMQRGILAHLLTLDSAFFQKNPPGALIERIQGDTKAVQGVWQVFITGVGRDIVALVSLFAVAISIDWKWTLFALIGAPLLILPTVLIQRYIRRKTRHLRQQAALLSTRLDEIFHGINPIKLNRLEEYQQARFRGTIDRIVKAQVKMAGSQALMPAMIDIVTGLGFFGVLVLGGQDILSGEKTVGDFMSFFTAMTLAFQPLRRLGAVAGIWQTAAASLERLYQLMDEEPTILSPARPAPQPERHDLEFDDVHFAYEDLPVLRGLSLRAEDGRTTALVGASGAGKSTVFHVLTRLVEPQEGEVRIGGVPIRDMDLATLRGMFSVVTQDAALFDETIRENILLGRSDIPEERLREVLDAAHVSDFLDQLPGGLDAPAGPRGSSLSGGQRQRVAIARALLHDAPILLLDEATSALDAQSEALVQKALDRLSEGRTTLVIAHRLSTIRNADRIIVMDKGRVVDEGTHEELLARGGLYAQLHALQFRSEGPSADRIAAEKMGRRRRNGAAAASDSSRRGPASLLGDIFGRWFRR